MQCILRWCSARFLRSRAKAGKSLYKGCVKGVPPGETCETVWEEPDIKGEAEEECGFQGSSGVSLSHLQLREPRLQVILQEGAQLLPLLGQVAPVLQRNLKAGASSNSTRSSCLK